MCGRLVAEAEQINLVGKVEDRFSHHQVEVHFILMAEQRFR